jgi:hypothetical protein
MSRFAREKEKLAFLKHLDEWYFIGIMDIIVKRGVRWRRKRKITRRTRQRYNLCANMFSARDGRLLRKGRLTVMYPRIECGGLETGFALFAGPRHEQTQV